MPDNTAIVILAAGKGTRMKSATPKVMHKIANQPMISFLIAKLSKYSNITVVASPDNKDILTKEVYPHKVVIQEHQFGTADAVNSTKSILKNFGGNIMVLYGDTPLLTQGTIDNLLKVKQQEGADISLLGFIPPDPTGYGRIIMEAGEVKAIVEHKDASEDERRIDLCNSGIMCISAGKLFKWLDKIDNNNAGKEYYLTDLIKLCKIDGGKVALAMGNYQELLGINSLSELATAENIVQTNLRKSFMNAGVTLQDPATTYFSFDTKIGEGVIIEPCVYFGPGVTVEGNVRIRAFSHFEGANIGENANIGPFSRLRPDANVGKDVHIGNFVEIKKSRVEEGAKVNHLTYIGDATVGAKSNIGAGTITCNYDGFGKHHTEIGKGAFIGSNTALVAPVSIGDGAIIGAGSTITKDVTKDALALTRAVQIEKDRWAARFRQSKQVVKENK